jgi:hypothetical protein
MKEISDPAQGCIFQNVAKEIFFDTVENLVAVIEDEEPAKTAVLRIMKEFATIPTQTEEEKSKSMKKLEEQKMYDPNKPKEPSAMSLFSPVQCEHFITKVLPQILEDDLGDMRFAVKKTLLPCLLAIGNQISYELFITNVFDTFRKFVGDSVWGVRKACLEVMP